MRPVYTASNRPSGENINLLGNALFMSSRNNSLPEIQSPIRGYLGAHGTAYILPSGENANDPIAPVFVLPRSLDFLTGG